MALQADITNRLLHNLPPAEFALVGPHLELVDLPRDFQMAREGTPIEHCYFPDVGIGSIVVQSPEGHQCEAGLFGREGFAPVGAVLGAKVHSMDMMVQVPGSGHRIEAGTLEQLLTGAPALQQALRSYAYVLGIQTTYTALSNAVHPVDERLARWLLMCHDRTNGDEIPLTHEFISLMLAVRRPSVTTALHILEGNRFITAERGYITIRNREALEQFAADAYGAPEAEYRRVFASIG